MNVQQSASSKQSLRLERTHWLLALTNSLPSPLAFAETILALILFVLALAIIICRVLIGKPVALHLWGLWCRLLTT